MPARLDAPPTRILGRAATLTAFGLPLLVGEGIDLDGVGVAGTGREGMAATRVAIDPVGLRDAWAAAGADVERVRELLDGEELFMGIDRAPGVGYLITTRDVGNVLVSHDGMLVLCDPKPDVEEWPIILTAQALPLAATLRGFEVLHASGVVVRGRAVLFSAPAGHGKSSLAAAFVRSGASLLSDDAVTLEPCGEALLAHAGCGHIDLRTPEHERLSESERARLPGPSAYVDRKHRYAIGLASSSAPLAALFLIEWSKSGAAVERLDAVNPFELLATARTMSVQDPARLLRQLDITGLIASSARVYRLRVRPGLDASALAVLVEEELATWL